MNITSASLLLMRNKRFHIHPLTPTAAAWLTITLCPVVRINQFIYLLHTRVLLRYLLLPCTESTFTIFLILIRILSPCVSLPDSLTPTPVSRSQLCSLLIALQSFPVQQLKTHFPMTRIPSFLANRHNHLIEWPETTCLTSLNFHTWASD